MGFIGDIFNTIFYQPLFNGLILFYQYLPGRDFGVAIIFLTALTRIIIYPLMSWSIKSQKIMSEIQPKIKEIQKKFKDNKERQTREMLDLYKREKINPLGAFIPLLIQFPIIIAVFKVFSNGLNPGEMSVLYSFVPRPEIINPHFLGLINLAVPSVILAVLAGFVQFFQAKMMTPSLAKKPIENSADGSKAAAPDLSSMFGKQMLYFFPVITFIFLLRLPAALGLYWITTSLFQIIQQYLILRPKTVKQKEKI